MGIIIIDEDRLVVQILEDFLSELGYEVSSYPDVSDLRAEAQAQNPVDIILLDPKAPKEESLKKISEIHELYPSADIVIISSGEAPLSSQEAISLRVFWHLKKPFRLAEIELLLTRVYESRARM